MLPCMERGNQGFGRLPVLITADGAMIEQVLRMAAAVAVEIDVHADLEAVRGGWASAPLIMVGADLAGALAEDRPARRAGVVLVGAGAHDEGGVTGEIWRDAVELGAEHVVQLPDGGGWLIQRLGESVDGPSRGGFITAVTSASGGSGVSTLAGSLALAAQSISGRVLLIDGDAHGGGLDLLLGAEEASGIRWPDLAAAAGRLSTTTLDYALPHPDGVALLSHGRGDAVAVPAEAFAAVLAAGVRGYEQVFIDVPRSTWASAPDMLDRADRVILLVPGRVRGIAAAAAAIPWLRSFTKDLSVVVRATSRGVAAREVERALGLASLRVVPEQLQIATREDRGEPLLANDAYAKAVRAVLADALRANGPAA
jgi:secretion/DNA translocation related CpaE-like protein